MDRRQKMQLRQTPCEGSLTMAEIPGGEGESRQIEGMAIVFNRESVPLYEDDTLVIREVIAPEAVTRELLDRSDILATLYHDNNRILARSRSGHGTLSYDVTGEGVRFRFTPPDTEDGRTATALVERGELSGCSFAFFMDMADAEAQTRTERTGEDGRKEVIYTVRKIADVCDFTLCPRPAYEDTEVATSLRDAERAEDERTKKLAAEERHRQAEREADMAFIEALMKRDINF